MKQLWTTLEFNVKMIEPYYILSKGNARPEITLTLDYQGTPYGLLPIAALLRGHYLVALVGLGSVLGDLLTVTASSLSLTNETYRSFISSSPSPLLLSFFLFSQLPWYMQGAGTHSYPPAVNHRFYSRIHSSSRMLDDFIDTERYTNSQMEAMLVSKNKRYGLGWFKGRDKRPHCTVDEEPMLSKYVHGVSYIHAQAPWEENIGF